MKGGAPPLRHDAAMDEHETFGPDYWDERYCQQPALWSGQPNPHLVTEAEQLAPGRALDAGCGEGADAIWLAAHGWHVTAVDISAVALERARRVEGSEPVEWIRADLAAWEAPGPRWDLVNAQYLHLPPALRPPVWDQLAAAVRPGGSLLVAAHDPAELAHEGHGPDPDRFFTAEELITHLGPGWAVATNRRVPRPPDDHHVADLVVRLVRMAVTPSA